MLIVPHIYREEDRWTKIGFDLDIKDISATGYIYAAIEDGNALSVYGLDKFELSSATSYGSSWKQIKFYLSDLNTIGNNGLYLIKINDSISDIYYSNSNAHCKSFYCDSKKITTLSTRYGTAATGRGIRGKFNSIIFKHVKELGGVAIFDVVNTASNLLSTFLLPNLEKITLTSAFTTQTNTAILLSYVTPGMTINFPKLSSIVHNGILVSTAASKARIQTPNIKQLGQLCFTGSGIYKINDSRNYYANFLSADFLSSNVIPNVSPITSISTLTTNIPTRCFRACRINDVYAPNCLSVDDYAFYGCRLTDITNDTIEYIGKYAFAGNEKMERVTLPNLLSMETSGVFSDCSSLNYLYIGPAQIISGNTIAGTWLSNAYTPLASAELERTVLTVIMDGYNLSDFMKLKNFPFGFNGNFLSNSVTFYTGDGCLIERNGAYSDVWYNTSYIQAQSLTSATSTVGFLAYRHPSYVSGLIDVCNYTLSTEWHPEPSAYNILNFTGASTTKIGVKLTPIDSYFNYEIDFYGCNSIGLNTSHTIANASCVIAVLYSNLVNSIPNYALYNCINASVAWSYVNYISSVGSYAFYGCESFLNGGFAISYIPHNDYGGLSTIGAGAFGGVHNPVQFYFDEYVKSIGTSLFTGSWNLDYVNYNSDILQLSSHSAFPFGAANTNLYSTIFYDEATGIYMTPTKYRMYIARVAIPWEESIVLSSETRIYTTDNSDFLIYWGDGGYSVHASGSRPSHTYSSLSAAVSASSVSCVIGDTVYYSPAYQGYRVLSFSSNAKYIENYSTPSWCMKYSDGSWGGDPCGIVQSFTEIKET